MPQHAMALQRWFGDSRVTDEHGCPMQVYHGTRRSFSVFDAQAPRENPWLLGGDNGLGFFFTSNPGCSMDSGPWSGASGFAGTLDRDGETFAPFGANVLCVYLRICSPYRMTHGEYLRAGAKRDLRDRLQALGFDGIVVEDDTFIVFEPEQIKSVFNRGTFDVEDPDILH